MRIALCTLMLISIAGPNDTLWADCGDGIVDTGEDCDDGNTTSGDGCDSLCRQEFVADTCFWGIQYGDFNVSGAVTSADVIYLINYIFKSGPEPWPCDTHGDIDCSGSITASDLIRLLNHIFKGQPLPCDICWDSPMGPGCP